MPKAARVHPWASMYDNNTNVEPFMNSTTHSVISNTSWPSAKISRQLC